VIAGEDEELPGSPRVLSGRMGKLAVALGVARAAVLVGSRLATPGQN
jgi:hypothetical protein